jgi:predicted ATPase
MLDRLRLLLLLDNVEHLLPGAASVIGALLGAVPGITVLVTIRESLRLWWEHVRRVGPLPVPSADGAGS